MLLMIIVVILLTVLTQTGGLILLVSILAWPFINSKVKNRFINAFVKTLFFLILYVFTTIFLVPPLARLGGREPLPFVEEAFIAPAYMATGLMNRNYVRSELRKSIMITANEMNRKFPGTHINYLDANFPFFNSFPLFPHLSHNDGKKLDLSFMYYDVESGLPVNDVPSVIGYGICEEPLVNEENMPVICERKGYWQYSLLHRIVPQSNHKRYTFDQVRTKSLINIICDQPSIGKVFIEPHLKTRMKLQNKKIRFHGCQAVRHDDHIHIQLK